MSCMAQVPRAVVSERISISGMKTRWTDRLSLKASADPAKESAPRPGPSLEYVDHVVGDEATRFVAAICIDQPGSSAP